ncbi:MAG: TonB-dependent receptor [Gemmatimonadales bacterium]|nr:TonB-dependent receptor [Gemmatimonadales bacterium]NIN12823.1 TonB-dependent receptor [Gemmatimonadales bacterium]NIN48751.1 TonB-dependent receptor [Gemmatimonadales bacterium]NIP06215.1 TonB-dependent receptor [Gemmatimonadales bacterium]NIR01400.1 TonB-dependent receptor [Gemmatimonadales bacterium]
MTRSSIVLSISVLGAVVHVSPLQGQEPRDTVQLGPVVVTATRLATPRASIAATVTVLDGDELKARGIRYVMDALREVPGLTVVQSGSFGSLTSVFLRGGESDYVKVLVDGAPINDPGGAVDFANLTTDNVERIEIVRGPVSVLYGSDAVSGVVQIFTRQGRGSARGELGVRGGTYGSLDVDVGLSGGTESVNYAFAFARSTTDGLHQFNSDYDNTVWSGLIRARPDPRTDAQLSLRYSDSEFHFPTDGIGEVVDENAFRLQDRLTGSLDIGRSLTDRLEARLLLALSETDGGLDDRADGPSDTLGFFGFSSVQAVARRSADLRLNLYATEGNVVTVGAQLEEETERSFSESHSQFGSSTASLDVNRSNYGYYAQVHATPLAGLGITFGARLEDNERFGSFFTYRGGATYRLATGTRVRASIGKAFKEPTFFENFADSPFARGNPDLEPERTTSWEVGVEQVLLHGRLRLAATYFEQRFRDLIQFTFTVPAPGDPNYFNVAAANASGVEVEIRAVPLPEFTVGGSYTRLGADVVDAGFDAGPGAGFVVGERLLRRPTHTLAFGGSYRFLGRGSLSTRLSYVGNRDDRDFSTFPATPVVLPGYVRVDVAAEVGVVQRRGALPGFTATVRVENLFDEQYEQVFGFPSPRRTVLVGGRVGF